MPPKHRNERPLRAAGPVGAADEAHPGRPSDTSISVLTPDEPADPMGPPPPPAPPRGADGSSRPPRKPRKVAAFLLLTISSALVLVAVGVAGYPFYTDILAARQQKALKAQLAKAAQQSGDERLKLLDQYKNRSFTTGSPVTRIIIPKLAVDTVVVQGTSDEALAAGAGHYPETPLPGDLGNVAIAGHRTMNGHPFGDLDKLAPGDQVILQTPFARYTYQLVQPFDGHANPWVTTPDDWSIISVATHSSLLTLTTCNPKGQKTERLVARAEMVGAPQPVA